MKKPWYQKLVEGSIWLLAGLALLGSMLDYIGNAIQLISLPLAIWLTFILIALFVTIQLLLKVGKIKWVMHGNQPVTIKKLGIRFGMGLMGILVLVWLSVLLQNGRVRNASYSIVSNPVFSSTDSSFKILILPFYRECDYQDKSYDIGFVIARRFEQINKVDSVGLSVHYLNDTINYRNFSSRDADSLMKWHNANLIIFGNYSLRQCESENTDKICFKHQLSLKGWNFDEVNRNEENESIAFNGLEAIRQGTGQESIDYIIYYYSGYSAHLQKNYKRSIRLLKKIKDFQQNQDVLELLGENYLNLEQFIHAHQFLNKSLKLNPNDSVALYYMSRLQHELHDYEAAIFWIKKALPLIKDTAAFYEVLADYYDHIGDFDEAIKIAEKNLETDSNDVNSMWTLTNVYMKLNSPEMVKKLAIKILKIDSTYTFAIRRIAWAFMQEKNVPLQKYYLEKLLRLDSNDLEVLTNYGLTFYEEKDYRNAKKWLLKSLQIDSSNFNTLVNVADIYLAEGNLREALAYYQNALSINDKDISSRLNFGAVFLLMNKAQEAEKQFNLAIKNGAGEKASYSFASLFSYQKNREMTLSWLRRAINFDGKLGPVVRNNKSFSWLLTDKDFLILTK